MASDLHTLEDWVEPLLAKLDPAARRQLAATLGRKLRTSQRERIAAQKNADGTPYQARKFRQKSGRVKRRAMFVKLRQNKHLKVRADSTGVTVGFLGRVARLAEVHQRGLRDKVSPDGPTVKYPQRQLLGFTQGDIELIRDELIDYLAQ